ncbi:MAG: hypothetical protein JNK46_05645 [Methylobacteriaceae bacterium]|nr:hypothetical protein [Methylobacteriaceae bacterium]
MRILSFIIGVLLLAPGACGLFFVAAIPNPLAYAGILAGAVGVFLISKAMTKQSTIPPENGPSA